MGIGNRESAIDRSSERTGGQFTASFMLQALPVPRPPFPTTFRKSPCGIPGPAGSHP